MSRKDYRIYVADMIEAIEKIHRYLGTTSSLQEFLGNEMVIDAVTRNFEIIGEAAKSVPQEIKDKLS